MIQLSFPWLLLLLPTPIILRFLLPSHKESRPAVHVPFLNRLSRITGMQPEKGSSVAKGTQLQRFLVWLCWILVIFSLTRPQMVLEPVTKTVPTRDLLLLVDLSGSMETEDFVDKNGRKTDRLTAVKEVLDDFLANRKGDRVGLIFFGSAAFVQVPFTEDLDVCRTLLDEAQVRMAGPRTMMGDAIGLAINVF
jgi:Ca-activated chloride channel family protein